MILGMIFVLLTTNIEYSIAVSVTCSAFSLVITSLYHVDSFASIIYTIYVSVHVCAVVSQVH